MIGDRADGPLGKLIDVLFIFGLVGGTGTSLGLGTPILSESISSLLGYRADLRPRRLRHRRVDGDLRHHRLPGMEKGIKRLADANVYLGFLLCAFVLLAGPTVFILDTFTNSLGLLVTQLRQDEPLHRPGRAVRVSPDLDGLLLGLVDRLRPVHGSLRRPDLAGPDRPRGGAANLVWGSFGCWLFFAVFGNTALHDQLNGKVPVIEIMNEVSPQAAIVAVVEALPMGTFVLVLFVAMCFIYSATTLQASAYTIASVASRDLVAGESEPRRGTGCSGRWPSARWRSP